MSAPAKHSPSAQRNLPPALQLYCLEREVMFYDTDIGGVVHNLAYLRHIEEARTLMAAERLHLDMARMAQDQLYPVLVSTQIEYLKPATLGDTLLIQGQISRIQRARFWVDFQILPKRASAQQETGARQDRAPERAFVRCQQALSLVQMPEGKVQRLSQPQWLQWREILESRDSSR